MQFNIRVYGILINENNEVLVSDELIRGMYITKFPGGGLEIGEGTKDCIKREFLEELNLNIEVLEHFYTTDFYQQSAFNPTHQIISIYYLVQALEQIQNPLQTIPFTFSPKQKEIYQQKKQIESFRFIPLINLNEDVVTLPIDKIVVGLLTK